MNLVQELLSKPGYLKCGPKVISKKYNVSYKDALNALQEAKISKTKQIQNVNTTIEINSHRDEYQEFLEWKNRNILKQEDIEKSKRKALKPFLIGNKNNVICIADSHEPFCKPGYMEFVRKIQEQYNCGTVVHIGDEVDLCAISQWEKDPEGLSAGNEYEQALEKMKDWYRVFPEVKICIGNHTARPFRLARTVGIPKKFLKSYEEAWEAPKGWKWEDSWEINGVHYTHGTGLSGAGGAIKLASQYRQNCVIGHIHTEAGIQFNASKKDLIWGMQLGGAIDDKAYAFAYAKDQLKKSIIGVGVVLNGTLPIYIPMPL